MVMGSRVTHERAGLLGCSCGCYCGKNYLHPFSPRLTIFNAHLHCVMPTITFIMILVTCDSLFCEVAGFDLSMIIEIEIF